MTAHEQLMRTEAVRIPKLRNRVNGSCLALAQSIRDEGLRRPITLWTDGTLISGQRRLFAHQLMEMPRIPYVMVDTIEDAAKRLLGDNEDEYLARPWKPSEMCRLWDLLRRLDDPAAVKRADEARRRGVELRRQTQAGKRKPGRAGSTDDYVLGVVAPAFGMSETSARRLWRIYSMAYDATESRRELALESLNDIDAGVSTIWANYQRVVSGRVAPVSQPRPVKPTEAAEAARQITVWNKALPQMEGLVAGLVELGPPNAELTWVQVGPVHARLKAVRRDMEKIINQMRETS